MLMCSTCMAIIWKVDEGQRKRSKICMFILALSQVHVFISIIHVPVLSMYVCSPCLQLTVCPGLACLLKNGLL